MVSQEEQAVSAFRLWKDNIITNDIFFTMMGKIKGLNSPNSSNTDITPGQVNYIKRLISEGKIPSGQSLNITKQEAQILIHNVVNAPNKIENGNTKGEPSRNEQAQSGSEKTPEELKELYGTGEFEDY